MTNKILVAEDEKPMAKALELKLTSVGFEVEVAFDGEEAIKKIKDNKYDLILLDLVMPKVDGFDVLKEIQNLKLSTPVIVSSNLSQEEDRKKAKDLGAKDYFVKSDTTLNELVEKVKQNL